MSGGQSNITNENTTITCTAIFLVTEATGVRLLACVSFHVPTQVAALNEGIVAGWALIRPFPGMRANMGS